MECVNYVMLVCSCPLQPYICIIIVTPLKYVHSYICTTNQTSTFFVKSRHTQYIYYIYIDNIMYINESRFGSSVRDKQALQEENEHDGTRNKKGYDQKEDEVDYKEGAAEEKKKIYGGCFPINMFNKIHPNNNPSSLQHVWCIILRN